MPGPVKKWFMKRQAKKELKELASLFADDAEIVVSQSCFGLVHLRLPLRKPKLTHYMFYLDRSSTDQIPWE